MMLPVFGLGLLALGAALFVLLSRHERRRAAQGLPRHSVLRLIFAAAALLTLLFSGGCGLLFLANQDGQYVTWEAVAALSGPPLALGTTASWLMLTRSRSRLAGGIGLGLVFATATIWALVWRWLVYGDFQVLFSGLIGLVVTGVMAAVWQAGKAGPAA
jgi:hypothetical protein